MSNKNKVGRVYIPASGVATNKTKHNEGSPLIRLTGDEFATTAESALYNLNDINSDNGGGVLTNNGTVTFAHDSDLGETVGTYNGSSQYLSRATEAQFEVGTGSFIESIQFKTSTTGADQTLFSLGSGAGGAYRSLAIPSTNVIRAYITDGTDSAVVSDPISERWQDGKWHTATMLWDVSTFTLFLWVDGQLIGSDLDASVGDLDVASRSLIIGGLYTGPIVQYFNGQLANYHLIKSADYNAVQVLNQGIRESVYNGNASGWSLATNTLSRLNNRFGWGSSSTANDLQYATTVIDVEEGLYEIQTLTSNNTTYGKCDIIIDGVVVGTIDQYGGSATYNNFDTIKDVPLSAGRHVLKIKTNGNNASSSDFTTQFQWINLIKRDGHEEGGATEFLLLGDEIVQRNNDTWAFSAQTSEFYCNRMGNSTASDGKYTEGEIFLKGGLYSITFNYASSTNTAKMDLDFGNAEVLGQYDTYGSYAGGQSKTVIVKLNQGKNNIRLAINGKGSGDYYVNFEAVRGIRIGN